MMLSFFTESNILKNNNILFAAKSYGTPVKLACADHGATNITVKDISLFKWKRTTDAELIFPGIHKQSDGECQHSLQRDNSSSGVECLLTFSRRKIPSDLLIVAVYVCVSFPRLQKLPIYRTK